MDVSALRLTFDHAGASHIAAAPDALSAQGVPADAILAAVKSHLKGRVDGEAERRRMLAATPGSGQAMEYQETQAQAAAALKAPNSAAAEKYPMLAASIGIDIDPSTGQVAADVVGVARSVDAARGRWVAAGASIRGTRLAAKKAIDEAQTIEAASSAYAAVVWPALPSG